jgi:D-serine deaminase-like pyridoxal phosphate-dependent protein
MAMKPPVAVGMRLDEIDTPALVVDLDALERNLRRMFEFAQTAKLRLRPHAKTHKSPEIAARQIALGAVGVCCQKVSEAEILVEGGIGDVLVTNEVAGMHKLGRLAALARRARIGVLTDAIDNVAEIEAACARADARLYVLVEVDVGGRRCGVAPGVAAADLAAAIAEAPHLSFGGLQAYHGTAQHQREPAQRRDSIASAVEAVRLTLRGLRAAGLEAEIVSGAGTGTYEHEAASGVYNELQPGSYVFMDADYARNLGEDGRPVRSFEHALFVLTTVMSAPLPERCVVDAGHKALAIDSGMPTAWSLHGAVYQRPSDEHGVLDLSACRSRPRRGEKLLLVPGHCDPTVNLHDWYVGVRGMGSPQASVESLWPVAARGAMF